ncbi:MAG: Lrp/AsnC family transcriptional regulator [Pseudomonadota bacterium]
MAKTDNLHGKDAPARRLDAFDRKILSALEKDGSRGYAALGQEVGLSAPAVHERVKKLRAAGILRGMAPVMDPVAVGKPLLAFVHVDTVGWGKSRQTMALADHPEVEEIHSVAGDTCLLLKVRTRDTGDLEALLSLLYATPGVKATRSYVVLTTYLERPVQAGITETWPVIDHEPA